MHVRTYRTQEIFGSGKFFSVQVKAILVRKIWWLSTVSAYARYILCVSVNIGEENFANT